MKAVGKNDKEGMCMTREVLLNLMDIILTMQMAIIFVLVLVDEWRFSKEKTVFIILMYFIGMILAEYFIISNLRNPELSDIWIAMLQMATGLLLYAYLAKERDGRVFFVYFSVMSLMFVGDAVGDMLASVRNMWHLLVQIFTYLMIALVIYRFCKKPFLEVFHGLKKGWMLLSLIPLSICFAFAYFMRLMGPLYLHPELWSVALMLCLITGCVYVAFYIVFRNLKEQYEVREQQGKKDSQHDDDLSKVHLLTIEKHVDAIRSLDEQITQLRHDIHHFMHMQSVFLESGDISEAKNNLAILGENFEEAFSGIQLKDFTGHDVIDTLLSFYAKRAEQEQIFIQIKMDFPGFMDEYMEFVVVLSNLIEFAFRNCINSTEPTDKKISLIGRQYEKEYYLQITFNYYRAEYRYADGAPEAFVGEAGKNIEIFVKKHNGACNYLIDGNQARIWIVF